MKYVILSFAKITFHISLEFGFQLEMKPKHALISPFGVIILWHVFNVVNTILL